MSHLKSLPNINSFTVYVKPQGRSYKTMVNSFYFDVYISVDGDYITSSSAVFNTALVKLQTLKINKQTNT